MRNKTPIRIIIAGVALLVIIFTLTVVAIFIINYSSRESDNKEVEKQFSFEEMVNSYSDEIMIFYVQDNMKSKISKAQLIEAIGNYGYYDEGFYSDSVQIKEILGNNFIEGRKYELVESRQYYVVNEFDDKNMITSVYVRQIITDIMTYMSSDEKKVLIKVEEGQPYGKSIGKSVDEKSGKASFRVYIETKELDIENCKFRVENILDLNKNEFTTTNYEPKPDQVFDFEIGTYKLKIDCEDNGNIYKDTYVLSVMPNTGEKLEEEEIIIKVNNPFSPPELWLFEYIFTIDKKESDVVNKLGESIIDGETIYKGIEIKRGDIKLTITPVFEGVGITYDDKIPEIVKQEGIKFTKEPVYRLVEKNPFVGYYYFTNYTEDCQSDPKPLACHDNQVYMDRGGLDIKCDADSSNVLKCDELLKSINVNSREL